MCIFWISFLFIILWHFLSQGFRMNASSWPMFLLRTLNGAEMAPATAFKKVCVASKSFENIYWQCLHLKVVLMDVALISRSLWGPPKTHLSQAWSWRPWTRRTRISSALPPLEKWRATRSSSCSTAGGVPLITGASLTPGTSSLWAGAPSLSTASSHQATVVSSTSRGQHKSAHTARYEAHAVVF